MESGRRKFEGGGEKEKEVIYFYFLFVLSTTTTAKFHKESFQNQAASSFTCGESNGRKKKDERGTEKEKESSAHSASPTIL
jgi:hypothetical protein